ALRLLEGAAPRRNCQRLLRIGSLRQAKGQTRTNNCDGTPERAFHRLVSLRLTEPIVLQNCLVSQEIDATQLRRFPKSGAGARCRYAVRQMIPLLPHPTPNLEQAWRTSADHEQTARCD